MTERRSSTRRTVATGSAADFIPANPTLATLRDAAMTCLSSHLWTLGTQTVFGEGPAHAPVMIVGEQPGDQEDRAGHPFVGPSGRLLDRALEEAGIERDDVYVTNAVKHFKWERGEKSARRIHKKPNDAEIRACHPWLEEEIRLVQPEVVVCLGATAAQAIMGKNFKVTKERGRAAKSPAGGTVIATVHPSSVLRAPDPAARAQAGKDFLSDIKKVARHLS